MNRLRIALPFLLFLLIPFRPAPAEELRMSLRQALERALTASPGIRQGRYGPPIAGTYVQEAEGEFDHLLSFRAASSRVKQPSSTSFEELESSTEQSFAGAMAFGAKIRTGATYEVRFQSNDFITDNRFFVVRPRWTNALVFRFEQPLLRGGWSEYNNSTQRIAEAGERKSQQVYAGLLNTTLSAVERAYWRLSFALSDLAVKRKSVEVAEELLRISQRRLDAGAGTRVDVVQADAGLAEREKELILAEAAASDAQDLLRSYLYPFSDAPERALSIVPLDKPKDPEEGTEGTLPVRLVQAFEHRPELLAVQDDLEAAGLQVVRTKNELLPQLNFFGSAAVTSLDDDFIGSTGGIADGEYHDWELGLSLEFPLGNIAAKARQRRALLERSRTIASFEALKNQVVLEMRIAMRQVDTTRRAIHATRRATAAALAQFDAEVDRVKAEKSTNYRLLETEQDLSRARSQEALALVAYQVALVDVEEATGTYLMARGLVAPPPIETPEPESDEDPLLKNTE